MRQVDDGNNECVYKRRDVRVGDQRRGLGRTASPRVPALDTEQTVCNEEGERERERIKRWARKDQTRTREREHSQPSFRNTRRHSQTISVVMFCYEGVVYELVWLLFVHVGRE